MLHFLGLHHDIPVTKLMMHKKFPPPHPSHTPHRVSRPVSLRVSFVLFVAGLHYDIPVTKPMMYRKLKEKFLQNKDVSDIRTIDILVAKVTNVAARDGCATACDNWVTNLFLVSSQQRE